MKNFLLISLLALLTPGFDGDEDTVGDVINYIFEEDTEDYCECYCGNGYWSECER